MRGLIYDLALAPLTRRWYAAVLARVPDRARLLDVGIGTGAALAANARLVRAKQLSITGIDIDADYLWRCQRRLERARLCNQVKVYEQPFERHSGGPYHAVYFSASFMLLDDPAGALARACSLLLPGGSVLFTQTFEKRRSPIIERIKPRLAQLTTIEFGRVTYRDEFHAVLEQAGFVPDHEETLADLRSRRFALIEARAPATAAAAPVPPTLSSAAQLRLGANRPPAGS